MKRRRKSRLSRSGVVSTRIRPGMAVSLRSGAGTARAAAWSGELLAEVADGDVPGGRPVVRAQQRVAAAVAEDHRSTEEGAVGTEQEVHQRRRSPRAGRGARPGWAACRAAGPASASARMPATIGVSIMPGAMALRRRPDPAQSGPVALPAHPVGHAPAWWPGRPPGSHGRRRSRALSSSSWSEAGLDQVGGDGGLHGGRVRADGHGGAARGRAAGAGPRARRPCRSSSRRPAASRPGPAVPANPAQVTMPASAPPQRSVGLRRRRPGARRASPRSATMSVSSLSTPMTSPARRAEARGGGGADARGGAGDDDGALRQRGAPSGRRGPCRRARPWRPRCG